jgi:hypothetical protein
MLLFINHSLSQTSYQNQTTQESQRMKKVFNSNRSMLEFQLVDHNQIIHNDQHGKTASAHLPYKASHSLAFMPYQFPFSSLADIYNRKTSLLTD